MFESRVETILKVCENLKKCLKKFKKIEEIIEIVKEFLDFFF